MKFRFFHRYGFGIQSPWAYSLVRNVLFEPMRYYAFDDLQQKYPQLGRAERCRCEQLYRIVLEQKPHLIFMLGTCPQHVQDYLRTTAAIALQPSGKLSRIGSGEMVYVGSDAIMPSLPAEISDDALVIVDDIRRSNRLLWQQLLLHERVTAVFDIRHRGLLYFDSKRIRQNYFL